MTYRWARHSFSFSALGHNGGNGDRNRHARFILWADSAIIGQKLPNVSMIFIHCVQHMGQIDVIGSALAMMLGYRSGWMLLKPEGNQQSVQRGVHY